MIAFIADTHFTDKYVKWFGAGFFEKQLELFEKFLIVALDKKCKYILLGGDIFDSPGSITAENLGRLASVFKKYSEFIYLSCIGNHDIKLTNYQNFEETSLYCLEKLVGDNFICWKTNTFFPASLNKPDYEDSNYKFYLQHWDIGLSHIIINTPDLFKVDKIEEKQIIHLLHAPVGTRSAYGGLNIDDLVKDNYLKTPNLNLPIYFFGDQHTGWGIKYTSNATYINIGSFSKMNISESEALVQACFTDGNNFEIINFGLMGNVSTEYIKKAKRKKNITKIRRKVKSIEEITKELNYTQKHIIEINKRSA